MPGWRRFLEQSRSYMQIILLIAVVVSLAIGQWSTGAVLALLTVVNALARVGSSACRRTRPTCTVSTQRVSGNGLIRPPDRCTRPAGHQGVHAVSRAGVIARILGAGRDGAAAARHSHRKPPSPTTPRNV